MDALRVAAHIAGPEEREAIEEHLVHIASRSRTDRELLRRLITFAGHAYDYVILCEDTRLPPAVRARAREARFGIFDLVARVHRTADIERFARRRNDIFSELGIHPRSLALLDWCNVAVRIALGEPLRKTLGALDATRAQELLAHKVRFDLLAIELNIALDDLVDEGRDPRLFALAVERVFGETFVTQTFAEQSPVGQYFRRQLASAHEADDDSGARARYLDLVTELHQAVVRAGRDLAGPRWDESAWSLCMRRLIGSMMLSLVQNEQPDLLAHADLRADFHGDDLLRVHAANANRVPFELVGLWCYERFTGQELTEAERDRLMGAFEDLQIAQQLANCIATLEREIVEGDRSNWVVLRAEATWREMTLAQRAFLADETGIAHDLRARSLPVVADDLFRHLYQLVGKDDGRPWSQSIGAEGLRRIVSRMNAVRDVLDQWDRRVEAAIAGLRSVGFDARDTKRAQTDLLLLHLLLLKKSRLVDAEGRR